MTACLAMLVVLTVPATPAAPAPEAVRLVPWPAPTVELDPRSECGQAPDAREPIDGRVFSEEGPRRFEWRPAEGAAGYRLEISPNPWMTPAVNDADQVFRGTRARLEGLGPGTWFWRVSSVDAEGRARLSGRSPVSRFTLSADLPRSVAGD